MGLVEFIGVGPSDLILYISLNITALSDCPFKCRSFRARSLLGFTNGCVNPLGVGPSDLIRYIWHI